MFYKKIALKKIITTLLLIGFFSAAGINAYALTASVDKNAIGIRDTLTLTVSADEITRKSLDFSGLQNDFDIISTQQSKSTQLINGSMELRTDWQLTLMPKRTGTLLIPSFNLGSSVSDAISITVSQQNQTTIDSGNNSDDKEPVRVSIEISKNSAYVQEQIIVKIKLSTEVYLSREELQPLELQNALVVALDPQQYQPKTNGKPYIVIERSFAIFPQESGDLIIPSLNYDVALESMGGFFSRGRNDILHLHTDEQHINVKSIPSQFTGKDWQPANKLSLNETWSGSLDHLKIGEPITRTIIINADGLKAGQIAPIVNTNIDGLTFYQDQAQIAENKNSNGVQSSRAETIAIVPHHGGDFTLPAVNINWWNNNTQKMETESLPAKTIHVLGDTAQSIAASSQSSTTAATPEIKKELSQPATENKENALPLWIAILTGVFIFLSIALTLYVLKLKKHIQQLNREQLNSENELQEKEKNIWDILKSTAASKDASSFRKAVLNWAHFQWPDQKINTLDDISKLGMNEELTIALKELDKILYGNQASNDWDVNHLLKLLNEFRKHKKVDKRSSELKKLYVE